MTNCNRLPTSRCIIGLVVLLLALSLVPHSSAAQIGEAHVTFDLNEAIKYLKPREAMFDTTEVVRLDVLKIGPYHTIPNPFAWDFRRDRIIEEYGLTGNYRLVFRVPRIYNFNFDEQREGAFITMTPRDLTIPGLEIELKTIDEVADDIYRKQMRELWRETTVQAVVSREQGQSRGGGPLSIDVPLPLPGVVEKIIGEGEKSNIDISGRESISISGESRIVDPYIGVEGQQKQSLFPTLDLRQELDVRLQGQIGEKVNVQVDHSSQAIGPLSNRIRLNYKGFEDDVVKLIELGNTSLTLPGSQLVSFSGQAKGLFGVKALAQVGPMDLTVIASKEEGETSSSTFTPRGGVLGQTEERRIRSIDYVKNIYFYLDNPYDPIFADSATARAKRPALDSLDVYEYVTPIEIQIAEQNSQNLVTQFARAFVDRSTRGQDLRDAWAAVQAGQDPPPFQEGNFRLLQEGQDYLPVLDINTDLVVGIEMLRPVVNGKALAVSYANKGGDLVGSIYDLSLPPDTLYLELIKPIGANPNNEFGYTWDYMMRNIYNLGLSNIDEATLDIEIEDLVGNRLNPTVPEGSSVPWIRVFGLDQTDQFGTGPPDNRIDLKTGQIDFERGTITFPSLRPFDPNPVQTAAWTDSAFSFEKPPYDAVVSPQLYDEDPTRPEDYYFFDIVLQAQSTTRTFRLNAFNITENSEVVRLDGTTLQRGRDYTIDYETGEVELVGDVLDRLNPSSNISIDYEFQPIAGAGATTLMGFNSIFNISPQSKIGTTWLYESKGTASEKPRIGEEPTRAIVGGVNTTLNWNPNFLTDVVNWLPLVDTEARSVMTFIGEVAMSVPDPNTLGEVYIDDMEGIEDSDLITLSRRAWNPASPPVVETGAGVFDVLPSINTARAFWYNIEPDRGVHRRDLNPDLDERESSLVQSLDIEIDALTDADTSTTVADDDWAGVMTGFRAGGLDLSQGQFIELWINDFKQDPADRGGKIYIDLGRIDEDFYDPDEDFYNREDKDRNGFVVGSDPKTTDDTGLDGIVNGDPGDDPFDDYVLERQGQVPNARYSKINGTEGNRLEDDEDLDGSGGLDRINSFVRYEIDLANTEPVTDVIAEFPNHEGLNDPYHKNDAWRLYRIKMSDFVKVDKDGEPNFQQIKHMRIWFTDINTVVNPSYGRVQIVDFKIIGNRWEQDRIRYSHNDKIATVADSTVEFNIGVINTKQNPEYVPPIRPNERDQIEEKEQSLLVEYTNFEPGIGFRLRKRFLGQGQDFTQYKDLNHFVHSDQVFPPVDSLGYNPVEYYLQLAYDSLNYYEVRVPVTSEYFSGSGWARVMLSLTDLSDLKFAPEDSVVTGTARDLAQEGRYYETRMVGRPNLFNVRFLYAGMRYNSPPPVVPPPPALLFADRISGQFWIDDIYLGNRRKDIDFAQRLSTTINMGNVVTLNANWARTGPDFRSLRQSRGTGADRRNLSLSGRSNLQHFLPLFGFNIPFSANYTRNLSLPKYTPNSDTEITTESRRDSLRTEASTRGFSATVTRQGSRNVFMRYTFDKTKLNYALSETRTRSPSSADTSLSMNGTLDYSIRFSGKHDVKVHKGSRFRYWPNTMNLRLDASRRTSQRWRNVGGNLLPDPEYFAADLREVFDTRYVPFRSITSTYRLSISRDAARPHPRWSLYGTEIGRNQNVQMNYKPPPIWGVRALKPDINYQVGYNENSSPNAARPGDPEGTRNAGQTQDISVKASYDIGRYATDFLRRFGLVDDNAKAPKGQPPRPPGPAPGTQPPDSTGAAAADTTQSGDGPAEEKEVDKLVAVKKLTAIIANFRRLNGSYRHRVTSNYTRIPDRPSVWYTLGLSDNSGVTGVVDGEVVVYDFPNRLQETNTYTFDTGTQLTRNIDVTGRFSTTLTSTRYREVGASTISETTGNTTVWPDVNLSWKGLEEFGIFRPLFTATSATFAWRQQTRETARGGDVQNRDVSRTLTPAIVFAWKNGINSNLTVSQTKNTSTSRGSLNETTSLSFALDLKYSFDAGRTIRLPFLKDKVLKSRLDSSLSVSYARTGGKRSTTPGFFTPVSKTTNFRIGPRVTYSFTRALNGSFFFDYSRLYNEATDQKTTVVRVGVDAIFTF